MIIDLCGAVKNETALCKSSAKSIGDNEWKISKMQSI